MSTLTIVTGKSNTVIRNVRNQKMQINLRGFIIKLASCTI